jgi:hypothetical protein
VETLKDFLGKNTSTKFEGAESHQVKNIKETYHLSHKYQNFQGIKTNLRRGFSPMQQYLPK